MKEKRILLIAAMAIYAILGLALSFTPGGISWRDAGLALAVSLPVTLFAGFVIGTWWKPMKRRQGQ